MMNYKMDLEAKNNIDTKLFNITELRLLLHTYFYNTQRIADLIDLILRTGITSNVYSYDTINRSFTIKIKKTAVRKLPNYEHSPYFYYGIFNNVFKLFLMNNIDALCSIAKDHGFEHCITNDYIDNLVLGLYNVTCLSDNIVVVYL